MSKILEGLNTVQKEATSYTDGPMLILAGAGSGKTRVLTYKIAYLIEKEIVKPWEILAITFTNKAAKEMKERVKELLPESSNEVWLGTFHSICVRILKREIEALGYTREFNIMDEIDKQKVVKEIMKRLDIDDKQIPVNSICYEISSAKDKLKTAKEYIEENLWDFRKSKIAEVYKEYEKETKRNNSLDFDDIITLTVRLFKEKPDRLLYYQNKFKYILVDEYQDTNHAQFILISMLASDNGKICVVGDESQSIYGFRGADISNILSFEKQFKGAKIIKLEQNYRSTKTILDAANNIIKKNSSKLDKNLWTDNDEGDKIRYFTARNEYEEGEYIVDTIDRMIRNEKMKYSDFAVLFRTNAQARAIEEVFMRESTPYRLIGGLKFYSRKEIKDIVAYLKLIHNINDNIAFKRVVNEPKRGIGDTTVNALTEKSNESASSIFGFIDEPGNLDGMRASGNLIIFRDMIKELIKDKYTLGITDLIKKILLVTGYEEMLVKENTKESEGRLENIYEFMGVASEFEKENADNSLTEFLESIALVADTDNLDEGDEAVTLMTMHSAKGLEYDNVFIVGMEDGLFPSKRSMFEDGEVEEERRLCYVAITRARKNLYITNAKQRMLYGSTSYTIPSRFISEIPEHLYDDIAKGNIKSRKEKTNNEYMDNEYSSVQRKLGSVSESSISIDGAKKSKFGVSVENFLKNMGTPVPKAEVDLDKYKQGVKIKHKRFGVGIIQKVEAEDNDLKVEIVFENGQMKRLMAKFANLEIME
ncbi:MAG: 3'-5' exonuclease [Clostridia bacterium]|nr:3'-5' exonuclease [Clostridia bacterium]MDD4376011.1 3'-5' exonuclease [Clostridia bacterium]